MIIAVYGSANTKPDEPLYQNALELGRLLAQAGHTVMTGGYCGTMEAVSRGAADAGGKTIGVTCEEIDSWRPGGANPWVQVEISTPTLTKRLDYLTRQPDAMIALPGGIGTLCEITLALNLMAIASTPAKPCILIGPEWQSTYQTFFSQNGAYISEADQARLYFAPDASNAVSLLNHTLFLKE
ncbi:MAG: LOG family protein [Anaerolineaceae bacterium]